MRGRGQHNGVLFSRRVEAEVFGADVVSGKECKKRHAASGSFYNGTSVGFLPLDEADDGSYVHSGLTRSFNRRDRGGSGGADIIHNQHIGSGLAKTFDAATGAVRLLRFAQQEAVQQ